MLGRVSIIFDMSSVFHGCVLSSRHSAGKLGVGWAGVCSMASPNFPPKGGRNHYEGKHGVVWIK